MSPKKKKFDVPYYGRISTYTTRRFEKLISRIYECKSSLVTSSGLSAITLTLLCFLRKNDEILLTENCYEPIYNFAENDLKKFGITSKYYQSNQNEKLKKLITSKTRVIYIESPGSLNFEVDDIEKIVSIAKPRKIVTIMDNTWSTFLGCNPLKYGVDVVIESATKYLSGHSDNFLGIIAVNSEKHRKMIKQAAVRIGDFVSAESCFEAYKGLKTLKIRMEKHEKNAVKIFNYLKSNKMITNIFYLPDESNRFNKLWKKFHKINNGLITFSIKNNGNISVFVDSLNLFKIGFSWGGYESLILPLERLKPSRNISKNTNYWFRIHIGLENYEDLIKDIDNAMKKYAK